MKKIESRYCSWALALLFPCFYEGLLTLSCVLQLPSNINSWKITKTSTTALWYLFVILLCIVLRSPLWYLASSEGRKKSNKQSITITKCIIHNNIQIKLLRKHISQTMRATLIHRCWKQARVGVATRVKSIADQERM